MMRFATLLLAAIAIATPALAAEPVVVLRGSSAPPTPWYEPPPEPKIIVQQVYVPLYYLPVTSSPFSFHRAPFAPSARRNR
jgi:hypothetical protein